MTQLFDGDKLREVLRGVHIAKPETYPMLMAVEKYICRQTATLTREQFFAEFKGMGCKEHLKHWYIKKSVYFVLTDTRVIFRVNDYSGGGFLEFYETDNLRQALTVIQALMQAEGGK